MFSSPLAHKFSPVPALAGLREPGVYKFTAANCFVYILSARKLTGEPETGTKLETLSVPRCLCVLCSLRPGREIYAGGDKKLRKKLETMVIEHVN